MNLLLLLAFLWTTPADTLTLEQAHRYAAESHPLREQLDLQESIAGLRTQNLGVNYLPALSVRGQAVYHSSVAEISLPGTGTAISQPSQDQYKVALAVDQLLYDGGVTSQLKMLETIQRDLEKGRVEVELYKVKEQVNTAYFSVLILESQIVSLDLLREDLDARLRVVESLVENGVVLRSNANVLAAELISVDQQRIEAHSNREAAINVLSELIGRPVPAETVFLLPAVDLPEVDLPAVDLPAVDLPAVVPADPGLPPSDRARPEYAVFDASRTVLEGRADLVTRRGRPQLALFAETAFGRPPGLDFFETDFQPYYSAGIRLNWNPWTWNKTRRERRTLDLESRLIDAQERSFSRQIRIAVQQDLSDVSKFEKLLEIDSEVMALREEIAREAASQLSNGVITSSDYLVERNAASRAGLTRRIHQVQLVQAKLRYLTTIGE